VAHHPERDVHDGQENLNTVVAAAYNITIYCVYVYYFTQTPHEGKNVFSREKRDQDRQQKETTSGCEATACVVRDTAKMHIHAKGRVYYII